MTRSSQLVCGHILEFDDDFERTLRRKRKQPEFNPPSSSSEEEEEEQDMAVDNEQSRNFQPQDWTMPSLFAFNTLGQLKAKPMSLN